MSKNNVMVFSEMRPPVASHYGETPLRGKHVNKLIDLAQGEYADANGFRLTKEQVVKNYTDDARMSDPNWNNRHHVTASGFNKSNHTYYKVRIASYSAAHLAYHFIVLSVAILRQGLQEQARRASPPAAPT